MMFVKRIGALVCMLVMVSLLGSGCRRVKGTCCTTPNCQKKVTKRVGMVVGLRPGRMEEVYYTMRVSRVLTTYKGY